jgi:hypothetical protein
MEDKNNNLVKIKAIFYRGAKWFTGYIVEKMTLNDEDIKKISDYNDADKESYHKILVNWEILEYEKNEINSIQYESILKQLYDNSGNKLENKYIITYLLSDNSSRILPNINKKYINMYDYNTFMFGEISTNYNSNLDYSPFLWREARITSVNDDVTSKSFGKYYIDVDSSISPVWVDKHELRDTKSVTENIPQEGPEDEYIVYLKNKNFSENDKNQNCLQFLNQLLTNNNNEYKKLTEEFVTQQKKYVKTLEKERKREDEQRKHEENNIKIQPKSTPSSPTTSFKKSNVNKKNKIEDNINMSSRSFLDMSHGYTATPQRTKKPLNSDTNSDSDGYKNEEDEDGDDCGDGISSDISGNIIDTSGNSVIKFKKYTYKEVENHINDNYFDDNEYYSSALDIIATYLRGQKLIYMESKSHCETRLNLLMMPSILLSTAATVLASVITNYYWGSIFIAGINGLIAFLLAIVNYLKLDAASEAHKTSSHQYDKLQTTVEFMSGKTLLFSYDPSKNDISERLTDIENKIGDIKGTNQFIIPKQIRTMYPIVYNTNVFLIIKKIEDLRKRKINSLKEVKNSKNYLKTLVKARRSRGLSCKKYTKEIEFLQKEKERHINNLLVLKSAFSIIDDMFVKEMENAEINKKIWLKKWLYSLFFCSLCNCNTICCKLFGKFFFKLCCNSNKFCNEICNDLYDDYDIWNNNDSNHINDPRKLSTFIEDVMDPYGRQDKRNKEDEKRDKEAKQKKQREDKQQQKENAIFENEKIKKVWIAIDKTKGLLKKNINITENLYDKLEKGELNGSKKKTNVVKLFGGNNEKPDFQNINLKIDEIKDLDSEQEQNSRRKNSDSSQSLDCDIEGECNK